MYELSNPDVIKSLLSKHKATLSKSLGQNLLINPSVCPRMAEMGGATQDVCVLEIGPGLGVLTVELARCAKKVVSIELDTKLLPVLSDTLADFNNIHVINGDVMKTDLAAIISDEFGSAETVVCANLPYYITSPVIMYLLESRLPVKSICVMVQKEVAQRLCAEPGSKDAGSISCAVSYFSEPHLLFDVLADSFLPKPRVDSSVIRLDIRSEPAVQVGDEALMFRVVHAAFGQRRKTLANALSSGLAITKDAAIGALCAVDISPSIRGERLTLQNFAAVADMLREQGVC